MPERLSFPELAPTRQNVAQALAKVSEHPDAARLLGVSPTLTEEIARNLVLHTAPAQAASAIYTGVLYDALDYGSLDTAAKRRANRWLVIVSALYGAVRPTDAIAPYRLSMAVNLPGVGPLASVWKPELAAVLPEPRPAVASSSTAAPARMPPPGLRERPLSERWVQVRVPGATHMAKHTRGLVARRLCEVGRDVRRVPQLVDLLADAFDVSLEQPARPGRPWILDATAR